MAVYKNVASQKIAVFAYDTANDTPKTGDAANITAQISLDGAATAATNDVNPTELDATDAPGIYLFDMTQAETNADLIVLAAVSATSDIKLEPVIIYTTPGTNAAILADMVRISGDSTAADNAEADYDGTGYAKANSTIGTCTTNNDKTGYSLTAGTGLGNQTADITGNLSGSVGSVTGNVGGNVVGSVASVTGGINTGAGIITTLDALDTAQDTQHSTTQTAISNLNDYDGSDTSGTTTLLSRLTATRAGYLDNLSAGAVATASALSTAAGNISTILGKFTGITLLAEWLGLLAGKQTGNSTARTELRATGAGSGTYDETVDSLEAIRDRGDTAWITATGFSTHSAAAVRAEMDSNSTQLAAIAADTNEVQTDLADGGRLDLLVDAIKAKTDNLPASPAAVGSQMDLVNAPNATAITAIQSGLSTFDVSSDTVITPSIYTARVDLTVDEANTRDEYSVQWMKNGAIVAVTGTPQIQVVKRADGTDLIAADDMTQIGSKDGAYKYDEDTARITAGAAVLVICTATIDGSTRTWPSMLARDSS